jgi:signal transduction histidine kinase
MLRRLLPLSVGIVGFVVTFLGALAAPNIAERHTRVAIVEHIDQTLRLMTAVGPALWADQADAVGRALADHEARTGTSIIVIASDGTVVASSRPGLVPSGPGERGQVAAALAGSLGMPEGAVWPWHREPLAVAVPIVDPSGGWFGAMLARWPSDAVRYATMRDWSGLAAVLVLTVLAVVGVTAGTTRWIALPVRRLTAAVRAMDQGGPRPAVADSGPPELRELAAALEDVSRRIRDQMARQNAFVSHASHQLRAPLAALRLRAEGIAADLPDRARAEHALLIEEIDRLAGICDAMLAFARARPMEAAVDVDLAAMLDARVAAWESAASVSGVTLRRDGDRPAWGRVPVEVLDQIVDVLLDNAIRYGGRGCTVAVRLQRADRDDVDIHIVDDGPGMTPAELARAAKPFWSGRQRADGRGAGLGLAIASALADSIGVRLHLSRVEPHGLDAWIRVPASSSLADAELTNRPQDSRVKAGAGRSAGPR